MSEQSPPPIPGAGSTDDRRHTLSEFVQQTSQKDRGEGFFELERDRVLEVHLGGSGGERVCMKAGAMIAYNGQIGFEREGMLDQGVGRFLKKQLTGEGASVTYATGRGTLYLADQGKKITILDLAGETMFVNGNDVLAFEPGLDYDVNMMRSLGAIAGGGLFNMRLTGHGMLAITTHYDPITLRVTPGGGEVFTDPQATIAWSGNLSPEFKTDVQLKSFFGRGSGESIQMKFNATNGEGFVVVQPFEESAMSSGAS